MNFIGFLFNFLPQKPLQPTQVSLHCPFIYRELREHAEVLIGDRYTVELLIEQEKMKHPNKTPTWYIEKIINDFHHQ